MKDLEHGVGTNEKIVPDLMVKNHRPSQYKKQRTYMTKEEKTAIITSLGERACLLFGVYVSHIGHDGYGFTDEEVRKECPYWTLRQIADTRRALTASGYFHKESDYTPTGQVKRYIHHIGHPKFKKAAKLKSQAAKCRKKQDNKTALVLEQRMRALLAT